jgi:transcriptional regulator with XRE-family HTH domain
MAITGAQLKAARELIGLSQLALAVQFQMGHREVANFEAGKVLYPDKFCAISNALSKQRA